MKVMQNVNTDTVIRYVDGSKQQVIDSRDVAKMIGKSHAHLMRDIHDYINVLELNSSLNQAILIQIIKSVPATC